MSLAVIDSHLHFFALDKGQYQWLKHSAPAWPNLSRIQQNHSLATIPPSSQFTLSHFIHVEAGFDNHAPINELNWLAETQPSLPYKAVSHAQIDAPPEQFATALAALKHRRSAAIRDLTQGSDGCRLLSPQVIENIQQLNRAGLHFEAQLEFSQIQLCDAFLKQLEANPDLKVVFNHAGFIDCHHHATSLLRRCGALPNVMLKCSGNEMLAQPLPTSQWLTHLLEQVGEDSLMLGSNFPIVLSVKKYWQVWQDYLTVLGHSSTWEKLSQTNAKRCYGL